MNPGTELRICVHWCDAEHTYKIMGKLSTGVSTPSSERAR